MPKKSTSTKSRIAVVLESTELEVYTHRGRRSLLARLTGQWLKVKATVFDNGLFRVKALEPGVKYEKLMALVKETTISVATVSGRANCLVLTNFHESSGSSKGGSQRGGGATTVKRVFHCKSVDKRHEWQTTLIAACAKGSKAVAGRQTLHKKKKPRSVLGSKKDDDHDGGRNGGRPRNLESFLQWHEEGYLYASFTRATKARRAWWRAIDAVARDVLNQRYHSRGYSSLALVRLHRKINQVDKDTVADIKRKARRILRHLLRELRVARKKKSNVTFADVVAREAAKHGVIIHDTTRGDRGDPRPSLEHHLAAAAAISPATMKDAAAAAAGGPPPPGTSSSSSPVVPPRRRRRGGSSSSCSSSSSRKDYNDSVFRDKLQNLLRRERVLPNLTRTLELIRRKDRDDFALADSMRGLWVARCVRGLLNLPGGLAALLTMSQERGSLRRLLFAALLCRVPLLTVLVLEMLAAFAVLPGKEGSAVVLNVLAQLDRAAHWGRPLCSDYLLRASPEALRWSPSCPRNPPPFSALATLLADSPEHTCCPELRCAVVTLFAALCTSQPNRSAAQWTQAKIFLACRAALKVDTPTPYARSAAASVPPPAVAAAKKSVVAELVAATTSPGLAKNPFVVGGQGAAQGAPQGQGAQGDTPLGQRGGGPDVNNDSPASSATTTSATTTKQKARQRRALLGRERASAAMTMSSAAAAAFDMVAPPDESELQNWGDYSSSSFPRPVEDDELHPCPPLLASLTNVQAEAQTQRGPHFDAHLTLYAMQLEHFLDGWDSRELDESDEIDDLPIGSSDRIDLLAERIRRSALLLGRYVSVDDALNALGLDLEHAAFLPFRALTASNPWRLPPKNDDFDDEEVDGRPRVALELTATAAAVAKLRGENIRGRPRDQAAARGLTAASGSVVHRPATSRAAAAADSGTFRAADSAGGAAAAVPPKFSKAAPAAMTSLQEDHRYAKYFKMIKMHVPRMAVAAKMTNDGLDPAALDMDPGGPPPDEESSRDSPIDVPRKTLSQASSDITNEKEPVSEEDGRPPIGCRRPPNRKLRRVFWDVIQDPTGTWWEAVIDRQERKLGLVTPADADDDDDAKEDRKREEDDFSSDSEEDSYFLTEDALDDLENVFGPTRREALSRADDTAKESAAKRERQSPVSPAVSERRNSATERPSRNLVSEALGEKRSFALNLLYGSIRLSNEECVSAVAALDPDGAVFVRNLPRLGTLYNIVARSDELQKIETKALDAGILVKKTGQLATRAVVVDGAANAGGGEKKPPAKLDALSELMVSLLERARRPRPKVRALWLYGTIRDQSSDISETIRNLEAATKAVTSSDCLKKILKVVLAVTNFLNHGTDRGQNRGIRVSALTKLRATKTTPTTAAAASSTTTSAARAVGAADAPPPCKNLLQFVVRHAGVAAADLKAQIPPALLRAVYNGPQRSAIASQLDDLRAERDDAANESAVLAREATTHQAPGVAARRVAVAAAAAARMACIVADVDDELAQLKVAYSKMDDAVDSMLQSFGEPATTVDATDWLRDLDTFVGHFDTEYNDMREHVLRRERRALLAQKQKARASFLSAPGDGSVGRRGSHSSLPSGEDLVVADDADDVDDDKGKVVKEFDKFVENAARGALVDQGRVWPVASKERRSLSSQAEGPPHLTVLADPVDCAECGETNSSATPGAFASHSRKVWFCADCWYEFAAKNPNWRDDFGEETQPDHA